MSSKKQPKCTKRSSGKGSITKAVDESHKESSIVIDSDDDTAMLIPQPSAASIKHEKEDIIGVVEDNTFFKGFLTQKKRSLHVKIECMS
jgi:hypothetical protein